MANNSGVIGYSERALASGGRAVTEAGRQGEQYRQTQSDLDESRRQLEALSRSIGTARSAQSQAARVGDVSPATLSQAEAAQLSPAERAQAAQLSPAERIQGTTAGPAQQAQTQGYRAALAQASQAQAAQLSPVERAQAAQIQGANIDPRQQQLLTALTSRALGQQPSIADAQAARMMEQNRQQQLSMAASQRGGNVGLAGRTAATNVARTNQDIAGQAMIASAQERQQAEQAASQALLGTRGQDINLATSQAGLSQQTALANQAAANQFSLQQGQFGQQANLMNAQQQMQASLANQAAANQSAQFGAQSQNAAALTNAQMGNQMAQFNAQQQQQAALANQALGGQFALQQGQFGQQAALANQAAANQFSLQQGQFGQQAALANMEAANQMGQFNTSLQQQQAMQNAQMQQQTALANQAAANQFTQAQWQNLAGLEGQQAGMSVQQQQMEAQNQQRLIDAYMGQAGLGMQAAGIQANMYSAQQQADLQRRGQNFQLGGSILGGLASMGAMAAMSDVNTKKDFASPKEQNKKLISALKGSKEYAYKEGYGQDTSKRYAGPMANDLPDSMVKEIGGIKHVDTGRFALSLGSVVGAQQKQIDRLTKALKSKKK